MNPEDVKKVMVVGAGTMGHSIAQVFAQAGIECNLVDLNQAILDRSLRLIRSNLDTLAEHGRVKGKDIPEIVGRVHTSTDLSQAAEGADFALEAVVEQSDVKKDVFKELDAACTESCVIASNTSSLDIFSIAEINKPERLVVTHWFAPPHIIPLVELAPGPLTSTRTMQDTSGLMKRIGKKPVVLKNFARSFIVNRIQNVIALTVFDMLEKNLAEPEDIDLAVKTSLGIRLPIVGVVQTMDFTGLGLIADINREFGLNPPAVIQEKVDKGLLGVSASKGFYDYGGRTEEEILKKRDEMYLEILAHLESIKAFEQV
jgi:3-hydroxybutyryl-CoA dehydrogenase